MLPERCLTRSDTVSNSAEYGGYQLSYLPTTSIDFWPLLEACGPHWKTSIGGGIVDRHLVFPGALRGGSSCRGRRALAGGFAAYVKLLPAGYCGLPFSLTRVNRPHSPAGGAGSLL